MPSSFSLILLEDRPRSQLPPPQVVRGVGASLLDGPAGHRAQRKPWAVGPMVRAQHDHAMIGWDVSWLSSEQCPLLALEPGLRLRLGQGQARLLSLQERQVAWEALGAELGPDVELAFESPTHFRQRGRTVPLPVPDLLFRHLADRWDTWSPTPVDRGVLDRLLASHEVRGVAVQTHLVTLKDATRPGFVGSIALRLDHGVPLEVRRLWQRLLGLAQLAGVGAGTTCGLGRVRLLGAAA